jgi:hypothetical protein
VERVVLNALAVDAAVPPNIAPSADFFAIAFGEVDPPWLRASVFQPLVLLMRIIQTIV